MAITYPLNLLDDFPGWSTDFSLLWRQEQSRHASGRTRVKDFGSPIWQATYNSKMLSANNLDIWKAKLNSLENGLKTFIAYPMSRCYPINHPGGAGNISALNPSILNISNIDRKSISLQNVNGLRLSMGDYIKIGNFLFQIMENASSNTAGNTPLFEIRPHLPVAVTTASAVSIIKPSCPMTIVPGTISTSASLNTGRGAISFQAVEARG